ncbi:hypothetical protein AB1L30_24355 [Bremerella sp. JC817]|uniref:hypothetical protein n=1 Tax=Bremerella sp. JC817 TaxID=3231756 RepID=UPI003457F636
MPALHWIRITVILAWLLVCLPLSHVAAEDGTNLQFPIPTHKPVSGLTLSVDNRWIDGSGYRPVRVTISTADGKPTPADRRLRVSLQPQFTYYRAEQPFPLVTQEIKLPQGESSVTETVLIPQHFRWESLRVNTSESGAMLPELSGGTSVRYGNQRDANFTEAFPATIVFHRNAPDRSDRVTWATEIRKQVNDGDLTGDVPDYRVMLNELAFFQSQTRQLMQPSKYGAIPLGFGNITRQDFLPLGDVPNDWLALSSADLIIFELEDLETLASEFPEKFAAIHQWLRCGGNLLLYEGGPDGKSKVDRLLGRDLSDTEDDWKHISFPASSLTSQDYFERLKSREDDYRVNDENRYAPIEVVGDATREINKGQIPSTSGAIPPLALDATTEEFGKIVLSEHTLFPGTTETWNRVLRSFGEERLAWYQRNGFSRLRQNDTFWEFLIPGVGKAPALTFALLITMFVILIGPVNYFMLRMSGRLNLLLFTIPAGALFVTLSLMAYAVVMDGFGTTARVRTVSHLNQRDGTGVSWSRQAYYASLALNSGLKFPKDAKVTELEYSPFGDGRSNRQIQWNDDQTFRGAYFPTRVTAQYVVIHPFQTEQKLDVRTTGEGTTVTNHLGTKIRYLLLVDENGEFLYGNNIADGGEKPLEPATEELHQFVQRYIETQRPRLPSNFDSIGYYQPRRYTLPTHEMPEIYLQDARYEDSLAESDFRNWFHALRGQPGMHRRKYLAIVDNFDQTPFGTEINRSHDSLDVILGEW